GLAGAYAKTLGNWRQALQLRQVMIYSKMARQSGNYFVDGILDGAVSLPESIICPDKEVGW
ncbi:MAG: hypothetical protein OXC81_05810, partial [Betaproteobacteria bacterium]|nr:hypothetical protein [Betaproteobacteria bacterium]